MSSVALPVSATGSALSAEADLARLAGRGDEEAFAELFRRHGQTAWRLAQAVTPSRDAAIRAVCDGFARAIRFRGRRGATDPFRPAVLAAVYRSAIDHIRHDGTATTSPAPDAAARAPKGRSKARSADLAVAESAFRTLPERWRAALWLAEVESMSYDHVAAALGVSSAVASQLVVRGQRGLAGRYSQAHRPLPEHIGPVLRPLGATVPTSLADDAAARWRASFDLPMDRLARVAAWLNDRAERPLQIATAALMALGLVGLGILGEGLATHTGPAAIRNSGAAGSVGVNGSSQGDGFLPNGSLNTSAELAAAAIPGLTSGFQSAAAQAAAAAGLGGAGGSSSTGGNPGSSPSTTLPPTGDQNPGTGSSPNPGQTLLAVPGVGQVQTGNNGTIIKLLPGSGGSSAVQITLGCDTGVGIRVGDVNIGCGSSSSSSTSTLPLPTTIPTLPTTIPTLPTTIPTLPITIPTLPTTIPTIPTTLPKL